MENCDVSVNLQEKQRGRRVSARLAGGARKTAARCPCCTDDQKHQNSAVPAKPPKKRKRTSSVRPSKPPAEHPEVLNGGPTPQPSTPAVDMPGSLDLVPKPRATISPDDLPVASNLVPSPEPSTAPLYHDEPLKIHNHSVEEYQRIYHEVVDDMLKTKSGQPRQYSLHLGRCIKQKLWERLNRPVFTESVDEDGRVHVDVSYGAGTNPPLYVVDISGEPEPERPNKKLRTA